VDVVDGEGLSFWKVEKTNTWVGVESAIEEAPVGVKGLTTRVFRRTGEDMADFGRPEVPWHCDTTERRLDKCRE